MPDTHLLTAKFARVLDGEIIAYLQGNESIQGAGNVRHSLAVMTAEQRAAEGILPIVITTPRPDPRWWTAITPVDVLQGEQVERTWNGVYDQAAHVAVMKDENRREAIRRIDSAEITGNDRTKFTLLASLLAKVVTALATQQPAIYGAMAQDLQPWAKVLQIQSIEAAINAQIESDPSLDLAAAWAAGEGA